MAQEELKWILQERDLLQQYEDIAMSDNPIAPQYDAFLTESYLTEISDEFPTSNKRGHFQAFASNYQDPGTDTQSHLSQQVKRMK